MKTIEFNMAFLTVGSFLSFKQGSRFLFEKKNTWMSSQFLCVCVCVRSSTRAPSNPAGMLVLLNPVNLTRVGPHFGPLPGSSLPTKT